jgi:carboxylate-amine ligase
LIDEGTRKAISFDAALEQILSELSDDVDALGVQAEVQHLRTIQSRGTSAHQQLWLYRALRRQKLPPKKAMRAVSKWLLESTEAGDFAAPDAYGASAASMASGSRSAGLTASGLFAG